MKSLGFNLFRVPFSNQMLLPSSVASGIDFSLNPDLYGLSPLQILDKFVAYCGSVGLRVILDRHSCLANNYLVETYWYLPGDPYYTEQQITADLVMLANRYSSTSTVIGIDLWNEPKTYSAWWKWSAAATTIGNAILAANPNLLIIVEGSGQNTWWGGNLQGVATLPVVLTAPNKLLYSIHEYGQCVFNQQWFSDPGFPYILKALWDSNWGYLLYNNNDPHPILVGEFGCPMTNPIDQTWLRTFFNYMNGDFGLNGINQLTGNQKGMSWIYWCVSPGGDTGGILNSDWVTVDQNKMSYLQSSFGAALL
jgi:aryl-phospho-beta-D-glucosidase BglC (GH1 family)